MKYETSKGQQFITKRNTFVGFVKTILNGECSTETVLKMRLVEKRRDYTMSLDCLVDDEGSIKDVVHIRPTVQVKGFPDRATTRIC